MVDFVFPDTSDVIDKTSLRKWLKNAAVFNDFVVSGLGLTNNGARVLKIGAGVFFVNGSYVEMNSDTFVTCTASQASVYVYIGYSEAAQDTIVAAINTTGVSPGANYLLVAICATDASNITSITDRRVWDAVGEMNWGVIPSSGSLTLTYNADGTPNVLTIKDKPSGTGTTVETITFTWSNGTPTQIVCTRGSRTLTVVFTWTNGSLTNVNRTVT